MDAQRLADDPADGVARVERRERVLEDHLHPPPQRLELALAERGDVLAVEDDPARGRLVQAEERPPDRRLAAARFADEAERLAAADLEADAVDRADVADVAVEHDPGLDREVDLEVLDLDEVAVAAAHPTAAARCSLQALCRHRVEARDPVARLDLPERRHLQARLLDLVAAARLERARAAAR